MKKIAIIDLDGTLAKISPYRAALLNQDTPVDIDAFYADSFDDHPITHNIELVRHLATKYRIVYCTARSERARTKTLNWLQKHNLPHKTTQLLMRPNGDERPTIDVKPELVRRYGIRLSEIAFVLEDDPHVIEKWKSLNIPCLMVHI